MLTEPQIDESLIALDRAVIEAVRARLAAGPWTGEAAAAIALRPLLAGCGPAEAAAVKAVMGRLEAARTPLATGGALAQVLAADRFGLSARPSADAEAALKAADGGARAVLDLSGRPWWGRLLARPDLRVIATLPDDPLSRPQAFVVARATTGPTGDDRSFWVTDSGWSDARIIEALSGAGLAAEALAASGGLKLFMLAGYVQAEDGRLDGAPGSLSGVIGAAPLF